MDTANLSALEGVGTDKESTIIQKQKTKPTFCMPCQPLQRQVAKPSQAWLPAGSDEESPRGKVCSQDGAGISVKEEPRLPLVCQADPHQHTMTVTLILNMDATMSCP